MAVHSGRYSLDTRAASGEAFGPLGQQPEHGSDAAEAYNIALVLILLP